MAQSLLYWQAAAAIFWSSGYPAFIFAPGTNVPYVALSFTGTGGGAADEYCYFIGVMPDSYTAAANITARIYWTAAAGASAADWVRFNVQYIGRENDEVYDAALSSAASADDQVIAVGDVHVASVSISTPALAPGDQVVFRLVRDYDYTGGATGMAEDAIVWGLQVLEA